MLKVQRLETCSRHDVLKVQRLATCSNSRSKGDVLKARAQGAKAGDFFKTTSKHLEHVASPAKTEKVFFVFI